MAVREAQTFFREAVDVRRADPRRALAPDVSIAQVIRIDEHDIGTTRLRGTEGHGGGGQLEGGAMAAGSEGEAAELTAGWYPGRRRRAPARSR